uniref:non-specific serine/threonine protein kinase n=1 Tax=Pseudolycopodium densum TaxID=73627 RepID=A0A059UJG8_PSEDB|nr:phototropin [Lycopodium deuterodensum]
MESSSMQTKRGAPGSLQQGFGGYSQQWLGIQPPRKARGSLEVFNPQGYSAKPAVIPAITPVSLEYNRGTQETRVRSDGQESDSESTERDTETRWTLKPLSFYPEATGKTPLEDGSGKGLAKPTNAPAPVDWELEPEISVNKELAEDSAVKEAENEGAKLSSVNEEDELQAKKDSRAIMTEAVLSARAAEWGLVVKADLSSDKGQTVRRHISWEDGQPGLSERISTTPKRTSEDSEGTNDLSSSHIPRVSKDLKDALSTFQQTFVVSDATKPDFPILYASAGFFDMTGYSSKEVIGRNCRFLQGARTDSADVANIREALSAGGSYCGRLLNYKKDGTPFWNLLTISPIKDDNGKILKFIGMQVEVSKYTEGLKEKALRPNGLPESLIRYDARQKDRAASSVTELVQAVKKPHSLPKPMDDIASMSPLLPKTPINFSHIDTPHSCNNMQQSCRTSDRRRSESAILNVPEVAAKRRHRSSGFFSMLGLSGKPPSPQEMDELYLSDGLINDEGERPDSIDDSDRAKEIRRGIDLATTLERIEKNFVITDPRLPDNPIIFASDSFLELTEYSREEIIGRNCRFLQGPDTDMETVKKIRDAIREQRDITVQLLNYTKTGKPFWNLFHLQAMRDQKGELQYFIGVQLDGSEQVEPSMKRLSERTEKESAKLVQATAVDVDEAVRELPDANLTPDDLWAKYSKVVVPKPHKVNSTPWTAIRKARSNGEKLGLKHFRPVKLLGCGDTGSVHLVELRGTGEFYAMKVMDKSVMLNRNKVHRACTERDILGMVDHPFLPALYASFQTKTHVCLITDFCAGGDLFMLLDKQPFKCFTEDTARFYAAEIVIALEYLHCLGVVYRDLKPENVLIQKDGHLLITDFDLSFISSSKPQLVRPVKPAGLRKKRKDSPLPTFVAEPLTRSNSFVGTEEYIAPEIINGAGHSSSVDWWALGILIYEMIFGYTPFRGKNRHKTFSNVLHKELSFPSSVPQVSLATKHLIHGLLQKDSAKRLGSKRGSNDLKGHPFFQGIKWSLIRCRLLPQLVAPVELMSEEQDVQSEVAKFDWDELEAAGAFSPELL